MSNKLQPVRGTHDILPDEFEKFNAVVSTARELATLYGFREMATPIFEQTEVFSRSMGETSDVVSKEMFTFETRGGESVTLRPEFTAGIARAFISNGMQQYLPLKLFTTGQLFRYERPQKGRQRQFHQVNFEWLGDDSWMADVEMITLAGRLLDWLSHTKGWKIDLHINTLGDAESREKYRVVLINYLTPFADKLSEDSKRRFTQNPLRILDSKDVSDQEIIKNAPIMTDYLSEEAKERFKKICDILQDKRCSINQKMIIDHTLVRGLDYYNGIVFEFVANTGDLGAKNTVLAGGRYDNLIELIGGKPTPAIGFAAGVERLLFLENEEWKINRLKIIVLPFDGLSEWSVLGCASGFCTKLYDRLKSANIQLTVEIYWHGKLSKRLEKAAKNGANYVAILSPEENEREAFIIKNMQTGVQHEVTDSDMHNEEKLKEIFNIV